MARVPAAPTTLEEVLTLAQLRAAWDEVRANRGAAGGDGVSLGRFEHLLQANLLRLGDDVRAGRYVPGRVRLVEIRTGTKVRTLTILPVSDRVLQRAALDALTPVLDPGFLQCSFGYRPGRSVRDAVARVVRLRNHGKRWVLDADIRDCFGSLDHDVLREVLAGQIADRGLLDLLDLWIGRPSRAARGICMLGGRGIPLGAVISPLFCNLYLHRLDVALQERRFHVVRYADDFIVLCRDEEEAQRALRATQRILAELRLELHEGKTRVVSFDEGFDFLGVHFRGDETHFEHEGKHIRLRRVPPRELTAYFPDYGESG